MPPEPHHIRIGGLMRCCVATVSEHEEKHPGEAKEGDRLPCAYGCGDGVILQEGAWRWDHGTV